MVMNNPDHLHLGPPPPPAHGPAASISAQTWGFWSFCRTSRRRIHAWPWTLLIRPTGCHPGLPLARVGGLWPWLVLPLGVLEGFNLISSPWGSPDVWSSPTEALGPNPPPLSKWSGLLGLKRWFWCRHALGCPSDPNRRVQLNASLHPATFLSGFLGILHWEKCTFLTAG